MNLKESNYEVEIEIDKINGLEEKMLFSGMCDFIIPMSFSNRGNKKIIKYHCEGFSPVRNVKKESIGKILEILEKTLLSLSKSIEFYILPEKIKLTLDTVFYNPKTKQVKIAYIPGEEENLHNKVLKFLEEIACDTEDIEEFVECIKDELELYDDDLSHMTRYIHEQRKRILQCIGTERGTMQWN